MSKSTFKGFCTNTAASKKAAQDAKQEALKIRTVALLMSCGATEEEARGIVKTRP